jgi:hypothetical protein
MPALKEIEIPITTIRGQRVLLDSDLAALYGVSTKVFNQAVKRHSYRFPEDFAFVLSGEEWLHLRSQIVTSSSEHGGGGTRPEFSLSMVPLWQPPF